MLTDYQWSDFWQGMKRRWPEWKPADIVESDWREALGKYDIFYLDKAVKQYLLENKKFNRPDLSVLHKIVRKFAAEHFNSQRQRVDTTELTWICYEKDEAGKGIIGFCQSYVGEVPLIDNITAHGNHLSDERGGRWLFVAGLREARAKRKEILHDAGLCGRYGFCPICEPERVKELGTVSSIGELVSAFTKRTKVLSGVAETKRQRVGQYRSMLADSQAVPEPSEFDLAGMEAMAEDDSVYSPPVAEPEDFDPNRLMKDDDIKF